MNKKGVSKARIKELEALVKQGAELLRVGAITQSYAVQEYLNNPEVKAIVEGK